MQPAGAARLGADGSAAGADGARAAGSPAAAPGGRRRPAQRLRCVVPPLREVRRTPQQVAARPLRVCDGARRGEGRSTSGDNAPQLVHGAALCVAAAAVPRLAGTGARGVLISHSYSHLFEPFLFTSFCSRTHLPLSVVAFFWTVTFILLWQSV